ncbi:MAG: hypothetical protein AMS18_12380 [Gemmatimonas sp. SG8_17]|nr:MAG: hypothetical protein AMS18_12380 [Gemmatimonas sp. SG8_17]
MTIRHILAAVLLAVPLLAFSSPPCVAQAPELVFDHNHTYAEVVDYLQRVVRTYPNITRLHTIGQSFEGRDLLVLEVTNQRTGDALTKPGFWMDGNLHASEVMGAEVCLKNIDVLINGYGNDPFITDLVDTRTIYIMPKLNPDGSDYYLTNPDGLRSSVRPHDSDRDGAFDEDPPEDLDGDGNILQMRIRDETGPMKTSPDDPRLMVRAEPGEPGEWRVYSEGVDNDDDGRFNEDGVGGLDINRNWPGQWQQEHIQGGAGPYPLSEPETRAVAEFLLSHPNVTGLINHHMAGNFVYRPPTALHFDPVTGEEQPMSPADESVFTFFGNKYSEILYDQRVTPVFGRSGPPRYGAIWGVMIGWAYDHYGVFSWVPEMGSYAPFADYDDDGDASEIERLRWNDTEMDGRIFVDWTPYDHPQLGQVEIGGFVGKLYDPDRGSYTSVMCTPGAVFEEFLAKHAEWNLWMASLSPRVQVTEVTMTPEESGYARITAKVQNQGYLPTNVTEQAIRNETAKPVKVSISLEGAELVFGDQTVDIGHLAGNRAGPVTVEWMIRSTRRGQPGVVVTAVSEKGGTDSKSLGG